MTVVWTAFIITAVLLVGVVCIFLRYKRKHEIAFRSAAKLLFTMAIGTALFPALLPPLGVKVWISSYIIFVLLLTGVMTIAVVAKARRSH